MFKIFHMLKEFCCLIHLECSWHICFCTLQCMQRLEKKVQMCISLKLILMALCKTAVSPLLMQWSYCSLALSHRYKYNFFHSESQEWSTGSCLVVLCYGLVRVNFDVTKHSGIFIWYMVSCFMMTWIWEFWCFASRKCTGESLHITLSVNVLVVDISS